MRMSSENKIVCLCKETVEKSQLLIHGEKCKAFQSAFAPLIEVTKSCARSCKDPLSQELLSEILLQLNLQVSAIQNHVHVDVPPPIPMKQTKVDDSIFCNACKTRFLDFNQVMYLQTCLHPFCKGCLKKRIFQ
jgi:hypothetical protein